MLRSNADVRAWATCGYLWKIATQPETQITHTRGGRQSLAPKKSTREIDCLQARVWVIWVSGFVAIFQR